MIDMTVQELIDKLQTVENKELRVYAELDGLERWEDIAEIELVDEMNDRVDLNLINL